MGDAAATQGGLTPILAEYTSQAAAVGRYAAGVRFDGAKRVVLVTEAEHAARLRLEKFDGPAGRRILTKVTKRAAQQVEQSR